MAKMCNKEEVDDLDKTITSLEEPTVDSKPIPRCESPVFKCVNHKPVRVARLDSSEYDIPSYQVNQSSKSKTCSKVESENNESILPFTPLFSPFPSSSFQFPSTSQSLGKSSKNSLNEQYDKGQSQKCNIFESLGMTDKDISWVSSMASPPPLQVPGTGFNTLEKATFLPEEKFQNIQPRALFSPSMNEDFGCKPLTFSSDSEDDEAYKSNIRLSDVCATLKQLEVKSLELSQNTDKCSETLSSQEVSTSPVIQTKKSKLEKRKSKKKEILMTSPKCNYEFSLTESLDNEKSSVGSSSSLKNFVEDDSFQSLSFSCIDELCKTLVNVTEQYDLQKTIDNDKTLVNDSVISESKLKSSTNKSVPKFYSSKTESNVYEVSVLDDLHSYAKALEEVDLNIPEGKKIDKTLAEKGIVSLDVLGEDSSKMNTAKRLRSELSEEKDTNLIKKAKTENDSSGWDEMREYLTESQINLNESEMFKTVENLEKTLASQEAKDKKIVENEEINADEIEKVQDCDTLNHEDFFKCSLPSVKFDENSSVVFTTASGSKISVGEDAFVKAQNIFKECDQNSVTGWTKPKISFQNTIKVSSGALEKAKALMFGEGKSAPKKIIEVSSEALEKAKAMWDENSTIKSHDDSNSEKSLNPEPVKFDKNLAVAFTTASGSKISVGEDAFMKAQNIFKECEQNSETSLTKPMIKSTIKVSPGALEKAKALMFGEGKSVSKKIIKVSPEALEKAKAMWDGNPSMKSSEIIKVSPEALEKAKAMWDGNTTIKSHDASNSENSLNPKPVKFDKNLAAAFTTASGPKISVGEDAFMKAQNIFKECEQNSETSLTKPKIKNTIKVSPGALEKAKALMFGEDKSVSKKIIKVSPESLEKAKAMWDGNPSMKSGEIIKVSPEALENAKEIMLSEEKPSTNWTGFSTGTGKTIKVSSKALEKAKALLASCDENSDAICAEGFSTNRCKKLESDNFKNPIIEKERNDFGDDMPGFSTALGNKVKISSEALEKARALLKSEDVECNSLAEGLEAFVPPTEHQEPFKGFSTAAGQKVNISDDALAKAKERTAQWELDKSEQPNLKPPKSFVEPSNNTTEYSTGVETTKESHLNENDWDEIIPSWLHVYNTSPSFASVNENSPVPEKSSEYLVKSPVLGSSDRFYKKVKRKKLRFDDTDTKGSVKRLSSTLPVDFSAPFKKFKNIESVENVKGRRAEVRLEQEKTGKEKQKVKPIVGSHLNKKLNEKQVTFRSAVEEEAPEVYSKKILKDFGVLEDIISVNIENASEFKFDGIEFFGPSCENNTDGFPVGDGCLIIPDDDCKFGIQEFRRAFMASPGVQPNLIPSGWVENHYKWIVWKLAHYEKSFPRFFGGRCLTPHNVMLQLKYRYDREIDRNERSALKKILERDDTSVKRLVLCVCKIKKIINDEFTDYEISLTDGWYSCPARFDPAMKRLIEKDKLTIGTKLVTQGAVLVNCDQGVSPLENNGDVYLKISTNSTRRVKWDTKLGFQKNPESIAISLGSILPQGGPISRLDVIIVRIYPMLYMEKTPDGHHVTRNLRSEEKAIADYQRIQELRVEKIYNEFHSKVKKSNAERKNTRKGNSQEDEENVKQIESSQNFTKNDLRKLEEELSKEKNNKRNVSEFLRMKVVDLKKPDYNNPALLTVWNPNEEVIHFFSEGKVISLRNVGLSNSSRAHKSMNINTCRQTQYKQINKRVKYPARQLTHFQDVSSKICPVFEEVDLVGVVIKLQDISYGSRLAQTIYLTDLESHFVGILFWENCKEYGWENTLTIHSVVACSNLQWKKIYTEKEVPSLHVNENSVFTENPKHYHLKEELNRLKMIISQDKSNILLKCEEELTIKLEELKWPTHKQGNRSVNGFESRPTASSTPIKPFPAGLVSDEAEPSPIQKRIEKLQSYGEPPPLMHLTLQNMRKPKKKL